MKITLKNLKEIIKNELLKEAKETSAELSNFFTNENMKNLNLDISSIEYDIENDDINNIKNQIIQNIKSAINLSNFDENFKKGFNVFYGQNNKIKDGILKGFETRIADFKISFESPSNKAENFLELLYLIDEGQKMIEKTGNFINPKTFQKDKESFIRLGSKGSPKK